MSDTNAMGELARTDDVDWSRYNQPFGSLTDTNPVLYKLPGGEIRQNDLDQAINLGMNFSGGGLATKIVPGSALSQIRAYHGSPHDFDRFDLGKIGTGEGAQAYGHGLYFAGNEDVARSYRAAGQPSYLGTDRIAAARDLLTQAGGDRQAAMALAQSRMSGTTKYGEGKLWQDVVNNFDDLVGRGPGHMYEVNINADPTQMLDWDKPLKDQAIADKVAALVPRDLRKPFDANVAAGITGSNAYRNYLPRENFAVRPTPTEAFQPHWGKTLEDALASVGNDPSRVRTIWNSEPQATSSMLNEARIPGIKYLDQGSRGTGGAGTSNYVVFDPSTVDILRKYGVVGAPAGTMAMGALADQSQYQEPEATP